MEIENNFLQPHMLNSSNMHNPFPKIQKKIQKVGRLYQQESGVEASRSRSLRNQTEKNGHSWDGFFV